MQANDHMSPGRPTPSGARKPSIVEDRPRELARCVPGSQASFTSGSAPSSPSAPGATRMDSGQMCPCATDWACMCCKPVSAFLRTTCAYLANPSRGSCRPIIRFGLLPDMPLFFGAPPLTVVSGVVKTNSGAMAPVQSTAWPRMGYTKELSKASSRIVAAVRSRLTKTACLADAFSSCVIFDHGLAPISLDLRSVVSFSTLTECHAAPVLVANWRVCVMASRSSWLSETSLSSEGLSMSKSNSAPSDSSSDASSQSLLHSSVRFSPSPNVRGEARSSCTPSRMSEKALSLNEILRPIDSSDPSDAWRFI
mmetsp:Transcript_11518/g.26715  ORF Transcript_11518/g.26715 Transcript_11518/m.26715 type:complete len:309 (+) Transcript_11518:509-1435(+)